MKTRKVIIELICLLLMMNFFFEGIYKIANWARYMHWMKRIPLLEGIWQFIAYGLPLVEFALALLFMKPSQRIKALYLSMVAFTIFVLWVMSAALFSHRIFGPLQHFWPKENWVDKMLIALGLGWMAFGAIILSKPFTKDQKLDSNSLRNISAEAS